MVDLDLSESEQGDFHVLSVGGEIDVYTAPVLREAVDGILDRDVSHLAIDLTGVDFLDSTGLGVVLGCNKRLDARDGALVVVCDKPHILKVFDVTGLTKIVDIRPSLDDV